MTIRMPKVPILAAAPLPPPPSSGSKHRFKRARGSAGRTSGTATLVPAIASPSDPRESRKTLLRGVEHRVLLRLNDDVAER